MTNQFIQFLYWLQHWVNFGSFDEQPKYSTIQHCCREMDNENGLISSLTMTIFNNNKVHIMFLRSDHLLFFSGFTGTIMGPLLGSIMTDCIPPEAYATASSFIVCLFNSGAAISYAVVGNT